MKIIKSFHEEHVIALDIGILHALSYSRLTKGIVGCMLEAAVVLVALVYTSHELVVVLNDDGDWHIEFFIATC